MEVDVDRIFTRLDTNDDGVVTIEEFIESCQTVGWCRLDVWVYNTG